MRLFLFILLCAFIHSQCNCYTPERIQRGLYEVGTATITQILPTEINYTIIWKDNRGNLYATQSLDTSNLRKGQTITTLVKL